MSQNVPPRPGASQGKSFISRDVFFIPKSKLISCSFVALFRYVITVLGSLPKNVSRLVRLIDLISTT